MPPAIHNEAYVAIEKSLADRLVKGWHKISGPFLRTIWKQIQDGDIARAKETAQAINLDPVLRDNLPYLHYITEAALLFGATRITEKAEDTDIAFGHPQAEDASDTAVRLLVAAVQQNAESSIRETLLQLIAKAAVELKFDQDQQRAPAGQPDGGQWVKQIADKAIPKHIIEAVESSVKVIGECKNKNDCANITRTLAEKHGEEIVKIIDSMPHNKREAVLIHKGDEARGIPTLWALGWGNVLGTDIHGHGKSEVGVTVLRGKVLEHAYVPEKPGEHLFEGSKQVGGLKIKTVTRTFEKGQTVALPAPYLHDVFGTSAFDNERDITLHAYFPPLKKMEYFQLSGDKLTWDGEWDEDKPEASSTKTRKAYFTHEHACHSRRFEMIVKFDPEQPRGYDGRWIPWNAPAMLKESLGIPRREMPQIAWKHYGDLIRFANDRGVEVTKGKVLAHTLKPAQSEYNPNKMRFVEKDKLKKPVIVSSDNYVLDGTHRWLYYLKFKPDHKMRIVRIGTNARNALAIMHHFPHAGIKDVHGNVLKFDPDQARVPAGEPGGGQWAKEGGGANLDPATKVWVVGGKPMASADQARLKALRVPPAWTEVRLNPSPTGDLQAVGKDVKGRTQYLYSAAHTEKAAAEKFLRLKEFNPKVPLIKEVSLRDMQTGRTPEVRDTAAVLHLISKTGFRIGSDADTKTKHRAFGASTLLGHHVRVDGDKLQFGFIAKKGVRVSKTIHDAELASYIRAKAVKGERLFSATDENKVRDYLHNIVGSKDFHVKDLRTWHGTAKAIERASKLRPPKTDKEYKKWRREIGKAVANHLGNTPAVALASYIDPSVFKPYHDKWGVKKVDSFDKMIALMNDYFETTHFAEDRVIMPWLLVVETGADPDDNDADSIYVLEEVEKFHDDQPRDVKGRWTRLINDLFPESRQRRWDTRLHSRYEDWMVGILQNYGDKAKTKHFGDGAVEAYDEKGKPLAFWDGYEGYAFPKIYMRHGLPAQVQKLAKIQDFTSFADAANTDADGMMQLLSSLHTSRVSAYGFLVEAKAMGYSQYQISAQLDVRGCPVCEFMDGKVFDIDALEDSLDEIFGAKSPDDLAHIQEWPGQGKKDLNELFEMSDEDIIANNWNLPPWHPNCRCLCVVIGTPELPKNTPSFEAAEEQQASFEPPKSLDEVLDKDIDKMANRLDGLEGPHALAVWEDLADEFGDDVLEELTGLTEADLLLGAKLNKKKFPGISD